MLAGTSLLVGCNDDGRTLRDAKPDQTQTIYTASTTTTVVATTGAGASIGVGTTTTVARSSFVLTLPWADGATIDARFTCAGDDVQPAVSWSGTPDGTKEIALVVRDLDADDFVHWAIAGIDPALGAIAESQAPVGAIEAANDFSSANQHVVGWCGPCPPAGAAHTYQTTLYALDQAIELPTGAAADDLVAAIEGSAFESVSVTGTYRTP
jgi:Raf kinase inhibitor-like YbhB/YbcL family protein